VPGARPADGKVDPADQKARDSDAKQILEGELRKEEEKLAALQKEYNNGEPERRGDERNYAKYQERVADLKASIARKEADIAALKRELSKFQ
jgi:chromosome segregation ATPase